MPNDQEFQGWLRYALRYLYDAGKLESSPLISTLGLEDQRHAPASLRRLLIETIHSLEPDPDTPPDCHAWRAYETLQYRYVQQLSQVEVAQQLGLSVRQLRREEQRAIQDLERMINTRYELGPEPAEPPLPDEQETVTEELAWVEERRGPDQVNLGDALAAVLKLLQPLADHHQFALQMPPCPQPCRVMVNPVALRQALLNLLTLAMDQGQGTPPELDITRQRDTLTVRIAAAQAAGETPLSAEALASVQMAQRLVAPYGAMLTLGDEAGRFSATLRLNAPGQVPVLLIDDNQDTWRLLGRYLDRSCYHLYPTGTLHEALEAAQGIAPRVIVLDVMMPNVDGWEMLGHLTQHPATAGVPIIVCTVLTQKELALSLGASAFMHKPFTREAFLDALDRLTGQAAPEFQEASAGS